LNKELTLVELGNHLRIKESLRVQDSDKPKGNNVAGPSVVNMVEHNNSSRYNDNKGKHKHHDNTRVDPSKKAKPTCWKCGKTSHIKRDWKGVIVGNKANGSGTKGSVDGSSNSLKGAIVHVCKDRCWFMTYESLKDGSILHMGNELIALVHGQDCVDLRLNIINDNIASAFMSTSKLNDSILWHARLGHVHFKRMQDMSKDGLIPAFDMDTEKCKTCMLTKITKKPFQNVKCETKVLELIHSDLCDLHATPSLGNKKYFVTFIDDASRFCYVYLLHTKDEALDKFKVFKTEVELQQGSLIKRFRTDRGGLSQGFWGEAMLTAFYLLNRVPNKRNRITPYELWTKRKPNLNYLRVWGCRAVVRLPDPKLKTLGERGIECIFVGYVEHSKAFRFYVIKPNELVSINSIIESNDAIFNENRFSSVPRPSLRIPNGTKDIGGSVVPQEVTEEKEAINDEMDSIMGNNTWVLANLPPGCKPIGCKWIFKRKLKVDGTIVKMDVKTTFLNGELDEEVYMNQPQGFIMPENENKVDLTKEFLSSKFSIKDMGEADIILGLRIKHESNGIAISQSYYIKKVLKKFSYFDCTLVSTPMDTSEKLMPNNGQAVSQLKYSRVIGCLVYAMTCTRPDIAFDVGKLSRYTSNPGTQHWQAIQRVFLFGGGAISWASKKQTCITDSTMKFEFMALPVIGKEAECAATLAKAYSQMYNGKSRHLGVRHSMIRELITNGVVSIEFVRSQRNLADHLMKGLARDLVLKCAEWIGLKFNQVAEC
ncbi:zinc finger, CCHC-type containing protein, partial [Tanacetum coccineum]